MRVYCGLTAVWASVFNRDGTAAVTAELSRLNPPFELSPLHEAQVRYLLNQKLQRPETRKTAVAAQAVWRNRLAEQIFIPSAHPLEFWHDAYQLVLKWQAGKLVVPPPQGMVHAALAALNGFDTFLSILPEARQHAQQMGLAVLPKTLG